MPRVTNPQATRRRRKKILKLAKGYFGNKSRLYRYAIGAVEHAQVYAYAHRKKRKSDFRRLWIVRINAACRQLGMRYSRFIAGLNAANIIMDRKNLSELAIHEPAAFAAVVERAKIALGEAKV